MKKTNSIILALAVAAGAAMQPANGQLPVGRPAGAIPKTIIGSGGFSGVGVPFTREPVARAVVDSVAGNTINVTGTPFVASAYIATPHTLVILTGPDRGRTLPITGNTTSSITVASAPPALVNGSDEFEVTPDWTLGTLFGTGLNPSGLASNGNANLADIVYLTAGGVLTQYFHNNTNWRTVASAANRNNASLGLNGGSLVLKRSAGNITYLVQGVLRSGRQDNTIVPLFGIQSYGDPLGATLATSGLVVDGDPGVGFVNAGPIQANGSSSLADIVYLPDPATGALTQYFHNTSNWRTIASAANRNDIPVLPQSAIMINKRSAGTSEWFITETFVP